VTRPSHDGLLTLEPLIEAIRLGVERATWELSGLQKTTSHQFEGRWEGESTRSAYLFFHPPEGPDYVSVDVYLDETSRGLSGNLALVVDLVPFGEMEGADEVLRALASVSVEQIAGGRRRPLTLRLRLPDVGDEPADAETEIRFKVRIPQRTIRAGASAVTAFSEEIMASFTLILGSEGLAKFTPADG